MSPMMAATLARSLQVTERAAEGLDFALISAALAFESLKSLQHFFHVFETLPEAVHDIVHLLDRALNAGFGGRLKMALRGRRCVVSGGFRFRLWLR
jgi:hypothetical protein